MTGFAKFIPSAGLAAPNLMMKAVGRVCAVVEAETKRWCPVDTGTLRNSYTTTFALAAYDPAGFVSSNVFYAPYVEYGTSRMGAQPHLSKGADAAVSQGIAEWVEETL